MNRGWRRCEARTEAIGETVAVCPGCGCVAFRGMGDDPWVNCYCGVRFNTNWVKQLGEIGVINDDKIIPYPELEPHLEPGGLKRA